jgi:hypothetical protein
VLDKPCHVAHQPVQQDRVMRQIVEIEPHGRLYAMPPLNPSFPAVFPGG